MTEQGNCGTLKFISRLGRTEMDLTTIDQPFGQLDFETKLALHRAFYEGKALECEGSNGKWYPVVCPSWDGQMTYRVKPEQMRDIELPWYVIRPEYKWAARDEDGEVFTFSAKPQISNDRNVWWAFGEGVECTRANNLIHDPGNKPWNESLIQRPEVVTP